MTKYFNLRLCISIILFTLILFVLWMQTNVTKLTIYSQNSEKSFFIELAVSESERYQGLSGRTMLDTDRGMLFIYNNGNDPKFWMKDTLIPLDIIFIGSDRRINAIAKNASPCTKEEEIIRGCPIYSSGNMSQYILELAGGTTEKYGINVGDYLKFPVKL